MYESGKAKAIGVSNYTVEHLEELLVNCRVPPMVLQAESHPHWPNKRLRDWCRKHDVVFQGYAPFGGTATETNSGHRPVDDDYLKTVATRNGLSTFEVCMQWNQARNSSTVVQSQNEKHLRQNLRSCHRPLCSAVEFKGIDEHAKDFSKYGPCYWGHNDRDHMNIWKDEEKMLEALLSDPRSKENSEEAQESWTPAVPTETLPPRVAGYK
eukprot:symbB.v1.2.023229.t2/scaffold2111.1/size89052/2